MTYLERLNPPVLPYPLITTPSPMMLSRALVRGSQGDDVKNIISDTIRWGNQAHLCLELENNQARFITQPKDTTKNTAVITEKNILLIHGGDAPRVWPALIDISKNTRPLWSWISEQTLGPNPFDISKGPLAFLNTIPKEPLLARWLASHTPAQNPALTRLAKGLTGLLSFHITGKGTFGINSRQWRSDGSTTNASAFIVINGDNKETPALQHDINTLLNHLTSSIPIKDQTATDWDHIQQPKPTCLTGPFSFHEPSQRGGHATVSLLADTKAVLDTLSIDITTWLT